VDTVASGEAALRYVAVGAPDLILLDVYLGGMDGFTVCERLKANPDTKLIPVVMVTALNSVEDRVRALDAGADDFLSKPVAGVELRARVTSLLRLKSLYDRLDETERIVFALARAVEAKDSYTEAHTARVAAAALALGKAIGLPDDELDHLYRGAMLHDIGKIGVPDGILLKPGSLTAEELERIQQHPAIGEDIARPLRSAHALLTIIRHHHERFDGTGYPDGLKGEDIPLLARIVAIADAFDAMTTNRPYRGARAEAEALDILEREAGRQWDPALVLTFLSDVVADLRRDLDAVRESERFTP
jgi:putative two-component system response regulator